MKRRKEKINMNGSFAWLRQTIMERDGRDTEDHQGPKDTMSPGIKGNNEPRDVKL